MSTAAGPRTSESPTSRREGLDVLRGLLLVGMVGLHVLSAHATAAQAGALHAGFNALLLSAGFVTLSGFIAGGRGGPLGRGDGLRALEACVHLLLVMGAYGVLLTLLRHGLALGAGGREACAVRGGWAPPERFGSLGILLPIALVQLQAPLARVRHPAWVLGPLALGWMLLPTLADALPPHGPWEAVLGVLTRRTLTPFYTVSTFVALGLVAALLSRLLPPEAGPRSPPGRLALGAGVLLASAPVWSGPLLEAAHAVGSAASALATLAFWTLVLHAQLRAFSAPPSSGPGPVRRALALAGRHSLFFFVLHDFLLELDTWARAVSGAPKGLGVALGLLGANLALLGLATRALERSPTVREAALHLLLARPRGGNVRQGAFSASGALALAAVMLAYSSVAAAGPRQALVVDDFEASAGGCPAWWRFGPLRLERAPGEAGRGQGMLSVSGQAGSPFAQGLGLYLDEDVGARRTLRLAVRGHGPGSGRLRVELGEDDNGNWELEKHARTFAPLHDDTWAQEVQVDWTGWRELALPLSAFQDAHPGGGNSRFDPERDLGSGGLLELQLLFAASGPGEGPVRMDLDDVRWMP